MSENVRLDGRHTVLIVDDEVSTTEFYEDVLVDDYDVRTANAGQAALDTLDSAVDVVLLDRRMPGLTGDEVLVEIRSRDVDCRVVMVTAVEPDAEIIALDFDDYLVKPVSPEELRDAVERMLVRKALDDRLQEVLALATKMATLEAKMDLEELEDSERYAALEERFAELRGPIGLVDPDDDPYARLSATKIEALFEFE